ncbi:hypothetical protein KP509_16G041600 [Ceratopteris richardii]|uniref:Uncharacterized protein n=1 Tax=Ceratopteris richardii TaxID=49495 RepID=A0A8T2T086_CERRI|nr:hypothetical protein KP509_16G041600 [Ceratopteris richardii]
MTEQEVEVRALDGRAAKLRVRSNQTVGDLKRMVQQQGSLCAPGLPFHLFLRGAKLGAGTLIESLTIQNGEFLVLMPYSRGRQAVTDLYQRSHDISGCESVSSTEVSVKHSISDKTIVEGPDRVHDLPSREGVENDSYRDVTNSAAVSVADSVWKEIAADLSEWRVAGFSSDSEQGIPGALDVSKTAESTERPIKKRSAKRDSLNLSDHASPDADEREPSTAGSSSPTSESRRKKPRKTWSCPIVLSRYYEIFKALNAVYGFLQKQNIQGTWQNMKAAVQQLLGASGEMLMVDEIETLASLFPKFIQISCCVGDGEAKSFNIDLLDPSKVPDDTIPRSLHEVMPLSLQKGIGPADLLPMPGMKQLNDTIIKCSMQKRLAAFQTAVNILMKRFEDGFSKDNRRKPKDYTAKDLLDFVSESGSSLQPKSKQTIPLPRPPRHHKKLARCTSTDDYSAEDMVEHLKEGLGSLGQIVHCEILEKREAEYCELKATLSQSTLAALKRIHISRFYKHQVEAIDVALSKQSVIVATSTASGKSVCYNVPVLEDLTSNMESCALYLFPTKALAQDQYRALLEMTSCINTPVNVGIYDGDTPQHLRLQFRDNSRILITNPDMLHVSMLPSHRQFERIFSSLSYVVVDEAHAYRGAFGCHTSLILRRMRRLCHHLYRIHPTFIVSSATVANPQEHAMELVGIRDIKVVQEDGSPCGRKYFILWDPPMSYSTKVLGNKDDSKEQKSKGSMGLEERKQIVKKKASPIVEISSLLAEMVQHNLRCICFCKTRKTSELVLNYTREILKETARGLIDSVKSYRSGYTAQDRREIETELFGGKLRAVAATNALELGVDVGSLDATLHLGFPGTVASLWQQAGRAGRREKSSLSVYVAFGSPLDQYFMKHPHKLFSRAIEHAQVDASNPQVLDGHATCAALEHPLNVEYDEEFFGSGLQSSISRLVSKGQLGREPMSFRQDGNWHYIGQERSPAQSLGIRAIEPEKYTVVNSATNAVIEEVEESKAFFEVYEGAVYIHQGKTFLVKTLDLGAKVAVCQEADLKYYTKTRDFTDVHVIGGELAYPRKAVNRSYLSTTAQATLCRVTTRWLGFRRIWQGTNQTFDSVQLFLPDYSYESQAAWIRVPHSIRGDIESSGLPFRAGLHAASHALMNIIPLHNLCLGSLF